MNKDKACLDRDTALTARSKAFIALASLRHSQSFGMSLKRAVRKGLVRIELSGEPDYHQRTASIVPTMEGQFLESQGERRLLAAIFEK